jgi:hypothetical protein
MDFFSDSTDRTPTDYVLFALAFIGFVIGLSGVVLTSAWAALSGLLILTLCILAFRLRPARDGDS